MEIDKCKWLELGWPTEWLMTTKTLLTLHCYHHVTTHFKHENSHFPNAKNAILPLADDTYQPSKILL